MADQRPKTPADRRIAREARSAEQRARAVQMRADGATYPDIGQALAVCPSRAAQIIAKAHRLASRPDWHNRLNNTRALNFLRVHDLATLPEREAGAATAEFSRRELLRQPNLGKAAVAAIRDWLATHGLALRGETHTTDTETGGPEGRPSDSDSSSPSQAGHHEAPSPCEITAVVT